MSAPLLSTKLYIPPPRPTIVLRPRLMERLNEGLSANRKLTLVSAPAGFGKTTLIGAWIAGGGRPAAWISLDEGDGDPARFLTYLVSALRTVSAAVGEGALAALQSPQPPPVESILTALLNDLAAVPDPIVLVLDDYHAVDSKPVDEALAFLIEHLPPPLHLVIATREDPHLPLARLRARGQLTELRAADLRFTPAEAAEFIHRMMGLNLPEENIAALEARTEGWIAGLQLAALSMQGHQDTASFIQSFTGSHHFVLDYLVEEVLDRQSESIRAFLLSTSILDRLCGPLCDAVLEASSGSGQTTLETLERANLFLVPLDSERRWYRYHQLFADVLQMHLAAERPDLATALHRRASEWYAKNGSTDNAIRHTLAAGDFERAAALIELAEPEMRRNRQGTAAVEIGWLKALPDELVRRRPVLSVAYAFALFNSGELEGVEPRLRDAERWLETPPDGRARPESMAAETFPEKSPQGEPNRGMVVVDEAEFRRLPGMIALLRAAQALAHGDMPETVKNARRVLDLAPPDDLLMLGGAASQLGLAAWADGDLESARRMTADGMENVRRAGYVSSAIGGAVTLADIQIVQGRLREAQATYERGLQWAAQPGAPVQRGAADMHTGLSALHRERNDLETARQHLLAGQALGELAGMPQNPYRWCAAMARIREARGDMDGALELLDQAERLYVANFSPNVRPIAARKARLWAARGRLDKALGWVREQKLSIDDKLSYLREFDHITLVRVLLDRHRSDRAEGSLAGATKLLERLLAAAEDGGRMGSAIEILVLQAIASHARGDLPTARAPLQKALTLAEPEGYVRMFLDEGPGMLQLLREAAARGIRPDYTARLLAEFEAGNQSNKETPGPMAARSQTELLSPRELEILKLIAAGLSNREIGERLFLALDTIKGHNRKIFDKLQVQSRTEAIARARELGLL